MMNEKIEINTLITKHENKCKDCRFDMIDVEDPLWEYGYPLKRVLIDNQTGETYDEVGKLVGLLNELETKCHKLEGELEESSAFIIEQREENKQLKKSEKINMEYAEQIVEENQQLRIAKNDLRIENEQLKKEYKIAIDEMVTDYKKLEKENDILKQKLRKNYIANKQYEELKRLQEENEKLRILLKDIYVDDELRKLAERYGVENE